jgi:hypothetical protein
VEKIEFIEKLLKVYKIDEKKFFYIGWFGLEVNWAYEF